MQETEPVHRSSFGVQRSPQRGALPVLGWAAFLACSWTWCIGMFLPVILLRDYGTFAWVVFALPNVVGAAAMGWVLQRPGQSEAMVRAHTPAMVAFSIVTIGFHVLFVSWVVRWVGDVGPLAGRSDWSGGTIMMAAAVGIAIVCLPLLMSRRTALVLSALLWAGSLSAFVATVMRTPRLPVPTGQPSIDLLYLGLVCLVGFALCPYADLTFHRARQSLTGYGSVAAFTLGFGALFLTMIVFTLWYGPMVVPPDARRSGLRVDELMPVAAGAIAWHMVAQAGFTCAAHSLEVLRRVRGEEGTKPARWGAVAGGLFVLAILIPMWVLLRRGFTYGDLGLHEIGYRLFLAFYGLITPAYLLLFVSPWPSRRSSPRSRWVALVITLALAGPAFWIGFIEQRMVWLTAGVAVVLLARPAVEWLSKSPTPIENPTPAGA